MSLPLPDTVDSMWAATAGPYTPRPALQEDTTVDVAIIGGGYTGLTTAYELRREDPSLSVAVLEAREIGYGSSGRNGSFAMTVVGLGFGATAMIKGKDFLIAAHRYMMRAVDTLDELVDRESLDCDKIRPGFLRVATTERYLRKIRKEVDLMNRLGFEDIFYLDKARVRERVTRPSTSAPSGSRGSSWSTPSSSSAPSATWPSATAPTSTRTHPSSASAAATASASRRPAGP
jgi:hypothetical protein